MIVGGAPSPRALCSSPRPPGGARARALPVPMVTTAPRSTRKRLARRRPADRLRRSETGGEDFAPRPAAPRPLGFPCPSCAGATTEISRTELVILYCDCPPEALAAAVPIHGRRGFPERERPDRGISAGGSRRGYPVEAAMRRASMPRFVTLGVLLTLGSRSTGGKTLAQAPAAGPDRGDGPPEQRLGPAGAHHLRARRRLRSASQRRPPRSRSSRKASW